MRVASEGRIEHGLRGGDPRAFTKLYRDYERPLLAFFMRRVGDAELAADLAAETFAAALAGRRSFLDGSREDAWLFGIAQHKLIDSIRHGRVVADARHRVAMEPILLSDADLERIEETAGPRVDVEAVLGTLPADQRAAVRAHIMEERSYGEIAAELKCSEAVVRKRVSRGLARLRQQIDLERGKR